MRKCFSMLLGAGIIALLTSCNFVATPNDGELAKDGLNHYVDWSSGTGGGGSDGGGSSGNSSIFTGCFIWSSAGPEAISLDFDDGKIIVFCNQTVTWGGFGLGQINSDGTEFVASSDLSSLDTIEYDVVAGTSSSYTLAVGDSGDGKSYSVSTDSKHEIISGISLGTNNYVLRIDGVAGFASESSALKITNLVFKDKSGNVITSFPLGDPLPEN